jgi:carboxypeptidase C (cathepsin A)
VGEFIRLYTTTNKRWSSPKFLAGESYGTTRAAGLAGHLQERHGMYLNGIVLISAILNFQTATFRRRQRPALRALPPELRRDRVVPQARRRVGGDLRGCSTKSRRFAIDEYLPALAKGDALSAKERERARGAARSLHGRCPRVTSTAATCASRSIASPRNCCATSAAPSAASTARFKGIDRDAAGERYEYDPSMSAILGPYTATLNDYVRRTLGYENDLPYEILTGRVQPWKYDQQNRYLNVAETLRQAMTRNPAAQGVRRGRLLRLRDAVLRAETTRSNHLGLDPSLRGTMSTSATTRPGT